MMERLSIPAFSFLRWSAMTGKSGLARVSGLGADVPTPLSEGAPPHSARAGFDATTGFELGIAGSGLRYGNGTPFLTPAADCDSCGLFRGGREAGAAAAAPSSADVDACSAITEPAAARLKLAPCGEVGFALLSDPLGRPGPRFMAGAPGEMVVLEVLADGIAGRAGFARGSNTGCGREGNAFGGCAALAGAIGCAALDGTGSSLATATRACCCGCFCTLPSLLSLWPPPLPPALSDRSGDSWCAFLVSFMRFGAA
mmetsp:Transcript_28654/g.67139  ORF Transcript_28654/g.67139 Transcript_28654/m.67139 type:complete len:256 (-) Transcript_28654:318-1085(-)